MYSLTRVWIGPKLARIADPGQGRGQDHERQRQAVDAELVLDAEQRDPAAVSTNWKPGAGRVEADQQRAATRPTSASAVPSADQRSRQRRRAGRRARSRRASGRKMTSDRSGMLGDVHRQRPARIEVRAGHHDQPDGDAQRVVLDAAGLDLAQLAAGVRRSARPMPLTVPSMTFTVEPPQARRRSARRCTMNSRWLRSSNHHLLSDARYRNGTPGGHARGRARAAGQPHRADVDAEAAARRARRRRRRRPRSRGSARRRCRTAGTRPPRWPSSSSASWNTGSSHWWIGSSPRRQAEQQAQEHRRDGEQDQRDRHDPRRLVDLGPTALRAAALAPERQAHQPEHVERGHARRRRGRSPRPSRSRA